MDALRLETWMAAYQRHLLAAVSEGDRYAYGPADVPRVVAKMRVAFESGAYNKDGEAVKRTCREFKIKHTYSAIKSYLQSIELD